MNRRGFLKLFGAGLPSVVVAEKLGLIERVRSYFFAPPQGWPVGMLTPEHLRHMLGPVRGDLLFVHPAQLEAFLFLSRDGLIQLDNSGPHFISEPILTEYTYGGLPVLSDPALPIGKFELRDVSPRNFKLHRRHWEFRRADNWLNLGRS